VVGPAAYHKKFTSQTVTFVLFFCAGNVQSLFISTDYKKVLLCLWRQYVVVGLVEYYKHFTTSIQFTCQPNSSP